MPNFVTTWFSRAASRNMLSLTPPERKSSSPSWRWSWTSPGRRPSGWCWWTRARRRWSASSATSHWLSISPQYMSTPLENLSRSAPVHCSGVSKTKTNTQGFAKDRKELILQYLSGLASPSQGKDQTVVHNFLSALGADLGKRDPMFYLNIIQKMKGEWYNQEGESSGPAWHCLLFNPISQVSRNRCYSWGVPMSLSWIISPYFLSKDWRLLISEVGTPSNLG